MNQSERRRYLIERLLEERKEYQQEDKIMKIPAGKEEQNTLLRSLMNVRMPSAIDEEFLHIQDAYLQQVNAEKGIVTLSEMEELEPELYLYKGDITRLKVGAIVNAANSGMTGCYQPCHNCIDKRNMSMRSIEILIMQLLLPQQFNMEICLIISVVRHAIVSSLWMLLQYQIAMRNMDLRIPYQNMI